MHEGGGRGRGRYQIFVSCSVPMWVLLGEKEEGDQEFAEQTSKTELRKECPRRGEPSEASTTLKAQFGKEKRKKWR